MKQTEKKNKHLTMEDRMEIQECLGKRMSFKVIGRLIEKDSTTASKAERHVKEVFKMIIMDNSTESSRISEIESWGNAGFLCSPLFYVGAT